MDIQDSIVAVVDDDKSVRDSLARLLRSAGMRAQVFESAEEFLNQSDLKAGCVVIDAQMPGMRGLELQERCLTLQPRLPVIMISAFFDEEAEGRTLARGARAYFHKPFDTICFLNVIRDALVNG